jgi:hypothetical protein
MILPARSRSGIEQHAGDHQVEAAAGALGRATRTELLVELRHTIDAAHIKVAPTAMEGYLQARVGVAGDRSHIAGDLGEPVRMVHKMAQPVSARQLQHLLAARADRRWRAYISNGVALCIGEFWHRDGSSVRP